METAMAGSSGEGEMVGPYFVHERRLTWVQLLETMHPGFDGNDGACNSLILLCVESCLLFNLAWPEAPFNRLVSGSNAYAYVANIPNPTFWLNLHLCRGIKG